MEDRLSDNLGELMGKAQSGSSEHYKLLLNEIHPIIQSFCLKRIGYLGCTEDVVQEILISIHKARATYDPKMPFKPWLFAISRYTLIDYLRTSKKHSRSLLLDDQTIETIINSDNLQNQEKDQNTENSDNLYAVRNAVGSLEPLYRDVLNLTKVQGLSTKEAAQKLGVSESVVKVRTHRAIGLLRKKLKRVANE